MLYLQDPKLVEVNIKAPMVVAFGKLVLDFWPRCQAAGPDCHVNIARRWVKFGFRALTMVWQVFSATGSGCTSAKNCNRFGKTGPPTKPALKIYQGLWPRPPNYPPISPKCQLLRAIRALGGVLGGGGLRVKGLGSRKLQALRPSNGPKSSAPKLKEPKPTGPMPP